MSANLDKKLLQHAALTAFDVKMIGFLAKNGGEQVYDANAATSKAAAAGKGATIAGINSLADRGLITCAESSPASGRYRLRLTDFGRAAAAQIEAMDVAPRVEVASPS